jgi:hypothetical protein
MKAAGGARMAEKKRKRDEGEAKKEDGAEVASQIERSVAEMQKGGPNMIEKSGEQEGRRSSMAAEEMNTERARDEYRGMAKTWKDGYLQGLDVCLQWQAENERLIKDSVKQGLSGSRQFLTWWKDWIEDQTQRQADVQRQANAPNPLLGFTKQSTVAVLTTVEPLLKNSEAALESTFGYYENAVATPSRKYVREINKQVLDAVISS